MTRRQRIQPVLRLRLEGPGVKSGRISVPELITICQQAQAAVNRQAQAAEGERTLRPGPIISKVQTECTLELIKIGRGSTTLDFGVEKPQLPLPFPDIVTDSSAAIRDVAEAIERFGKRTRAKSQVDRGVLDSLQKLGSVLEKKRISKIEWIIPGSGKRKRRTASYDIAAKERVEEAMRSLPAREPISVEGLLEMADFKPEDRRFRVDPPLGKPVVCSFDKEIEGNVYDALRQPVRVSGMGEFNRTTSELMTLHVDTVEVVEPVKIGSVDFDTGRSLKDLIKEQGVHPLRTIKQLQGGIPEDEPLDELLEEIYTTRS